MCVRESAHIKERGERNACLCVSETVCTVSVCVCVVCVWSQCIQLERLSHCYSSYGMMSLSQNRGSAVHQHRGHSHRLLTSPPLSSFLIINQSLPPPFSSLSLSLSLSHFLFLFLSLSPLSLSLSSSPLSVFPLPSLLSFISLTSLSS